jgi:hypothetical protein
MSIPILILVKKTIKNYLTYSKQIKVKNLSFSYCLKTSFIVYYREEKNICHTIEVKQH